MMIMLFYSCAMKGIQVWQQEHPRRLPDSNRRYRFIAFAIRFLIPAYCVFWYQCLRLTCEDMVVYDKAAVVVICTTEIYVRHDRTQLMSSFIF
jgi:hypothetical protein